MKRIAAILALCLLLTSCGGGDEGRAETGSGQDTTAYSPEQIAWSLWESQGAETPENSRGLTAGTDTEFFEYLAAYYQLDPEDVADGYIRCAGGMSGFELAVLHLREDADMTAAEEALLQYRDARAGDFTGYLPEQAELVEHGVTVLQGNWAALLLCPQTETARDAFLLCFGEDAPAPETPRWPGEPIEEPAEEEPQEGPVSAPPEEPSGEARTETAGEPAQESPAPSEDPAASVPAPSEAPSAPTQESLSPAPPPAEEAEPNPEPEPEPQPAPIPDVYDGAAVRAAWRSGDDSGLTEKNRAVLEAAREAMDACVRTGMSDYEKELALHDWMVAWGGYDHDTLSHLPGEEGGSDNDNPYGFLVEGKGICLGYASTFQLFMDLLGIPCRTVRGLAHAGTADHAWNLVQLDGEWYAVDVTWDDPTTSLPVSEETAHRYFNVTSRFLRDNDHQWDGSGVPEAEGADWAWKRP